jgi:two-component system, LytTR family, response regulator
MLDSIKMRPTVPAYANSGRRALPKSFITSLKADEEHIRRLRLTGISIGAWTGIAALFSFQRLLALAVRGTDPAWGRLALEMTITWGGWALLTPLISLIVRRLPLRFDKPWRPILHVPAGIGVGLLHSLVVATITPLFIWRPSFLPMRDMFTGRLVSAVAFETLIYFMVAGVMYAYIYAARLREAGSPTPNPDSIAVPDRGGLVRVPVESIDWVQAEDNYVRLHAGGRSHLFRATLASFEKRLAPSDFVRVHRSAMVRVPRIAELKRGGADRYTVLLTNGTQLRVSRAYRKRVADAIQAPLATP